MSCDNYDSIETEVKEMWMVKTRRMFGYRCYLISGKVFAGFDTKTDFRIIIRLPKDQQQIAIKHPAIKPFSFGARTGWAELDYRRATTNLAMKWIWEGYEYAQRLAANARRDTTF